MKELFYKGCALFTMVVIAMTTIPAAIAHTYAGSPAYHHWAIGEIVTAADLNNTFDHVHNTFSANIADAHISPTAAISHSKMKFPAVLPKGFYMTTDPCSSSPCTLLINSGATVTTITRASAGNYTATLAGTRSNATYSGLITPQNGGTTKVFCSFVALSVTQFQIVCFNDTGTATDTGLTIALMDDDN